MTLPSGVRASAAFMARPRRERALLMATGAAGVMLAGWLLWIEPEVVQRNRLRREIQEHAIDLQSLQPRLDALQGRGADPDAGRKAQVELLRSQIARVDAEFAGMERTLVAPRDMGHVVEGLLRQHGGLQLVAWRSLPVTPISDLLAEPRSGAAAGPASAAGRPVPAPDAAASQADGWLYLHGIEISVSGNYADMHSWLQQVEHLPRRLYWGPLTIDARTWPTSVMTVTLYTVGVERTWWAL